MLKIKDILVNHYTEPLGYDLDNHLRIEFSAEANQKASHIQKRLTINAHKPVYDSHWQQYDNNYFDFELELKPRTRYEITIFLKDNHTQTSKNSFFETGKMNEPFTAEWIGNHNKDIQNTLLKKSIDITKKVVNARLYISGLGVYEAFLNKKKIGNEFLAPGVTAYDKLVQIQTYDVTEMLNEKSQQELLISLGDGWYKGNFGFDGGQNCIYGDQQMAIAELHIAYDDGSNQIINTDATWQTSAGKITKSAIYYGEDFDDTKKITNWQPAIILQHSKEILHDRLSLPLKTKEYLPVKEIIRTPKGETVLDFGQDHAGWPEFYNHESAGKEIDLQMGEILQDGNFYRDNLRQARAAFHYISNGEQKWIRPHFTYYGYRYVKVSGNSQPLRKEDFKDAVIYSDLEITGGIKTSNTKVNRLLQNVLWSQKSNFFDVPTDCPQRDERLGWTGDADIFSGTAILNMNAYPFFKKYAKDMKIEQAAHQGMLTMYAPAMGNDNGGAAIWGDAATVIPWTAYQATADPAILRQNYSSMKAWVDWIGQATTTKNLWTGCFQFGDWLSLDGENPAIPSGKTDEDYIASIYYAYSSWIVAQAARILGNTTDAQEYDRQSQAIKKAIRDEFITKNGRLAIDTQTAYALALHFELVPEEQKKRVVNDLVQRLKKDHNHLQTGFIGTPFICQVLSENGEHKLATQIFLNEDFPSWLYEVILGATTIWERWNSVLPDGSMNPAGMNSLNHYSIGAIMQWVYQQVLGLRKQNNGYQNVLFAPQFDYRFKKISGHYHSSYGDLKMAYQLETDAQHTIKVNLSIPFGQRVTVKLPRVKDKVEINGRQSSLPLELTNGDFTISYVPEKSYIEYYNINMPVKELMSDAELVKELRPIHTVFDFLQDPDNLKKFGENSMVELNSLLPFINISDEDFNQINKILDTTPVTSERKFLNERRSL
ncbi:family 78 glycoside hydrolase catalytic domain [Lactobacillus sp. M0398]|uniref:alpha-L-rhamnosidase n=1 Tax=unclassified Lactobacillus TaxID=2620435 RepID=UPI0018DCA38A|nr:MULTISPECIES: alpha-L-rhamnosidase [unclassified Lactobacillus]MBI0120479.1 family 78 glycoside hydrolase catalytic domain [Lactobacillus sp. M0398]MBI0122627.1 family 78 glycoside hydrolase catalytic domain [Lactobacillus sp. W8174]MBI0134309.1 family 78 glycoside hydrolase catalytic domain [Lactobacillus sp. W8173]